MKYSEFFIPTQKEKSSDAKIKSHILMIKSGMIRQETSGIYSWLPLGFRILQKIIKIIEKFHEAAGVNQILMPTIQSADIWKQSDRYETYGKEMLRIIDRHEKELLYGPTNEEMVTVLAKSFIKSYKNLPRYFFHIQSKFRDEIRPRFGVMRAREFLMKDAYSFDLDEKSGEKTYLMFFNLYLKIFKELGINVIPVRAPAGEIGGNLSHEFHLIVESGESEIYLDESLISTDFSNYSINDVMALSSYTDEFFKTNEIKLNLKKFKSIELGHIFLFGNKYSKSFNFFVDGEKDKFFPFMGSYGIGVSRIPAAVIESSNKKDGVIWPKNISPFSSIILNLDHKSDSVNKFCEEIYYGLKCDGIDILYDNRNERPGVKFSDAELMGIPLIIIIGKNYLNKQSITLINKYSNLEIDVPKSEAKNEIKRFIDELND
ncbi:MAG: proline--tRNA ligase [Alphaproteobacteria bacterium]